MDFFKSPEEYGIKLIAFAMNNPEEALKVLFDAPVNFPQVPNSFWADVAKYLVKRINKSK